MHYKTSRQHLVKKKKNCSWDRKISCVNHFRSFRSWPFCLMRFHHTLQPCFLLTDGCSTTIPGSHASSLWSCEQIHFLRSILHAAEKVLEAVKMIVSLIHDLDMTAMHPPFLALDNRLLVIGNRQLVIGNWLLVIGDRYFVIGNLSEFLYKEQ